MSAEFSNRVRKIVEGDQAAKEWLYDTFGGSLFRRLGARYRQRGLDPEELLHDAFVFYFQNDGRVIAQYLSHTPVEDQDEESLDHHLWNLACGVATNRLRSRKLRRRFATDSDIDDLPEPGSAHPEMEIVDRDLIDRFGDCLRGHGDRLFTYYALRFRDGMTAEEIGAATGWSMNEIYALRTKLNHAAEKCAEVLRMFVR